MKYRFLCVDDEKRSLQTLSRICTEQNKDNEVFGFDNPFDALEFCKAHTVDVALLDIDMPSVNGIQLSEKLTAFIPRLNIILVTAFSDYALDAFNRNCSGYLLKPLTLTALNEQLSVLRFPVSEHEKKISVHCFGDFDVFFEGKSVQFNYKKSKELLAYLVDRRGCACTNHQIASVLWEDDEDHTEYLKKVKKDLNDTLEALQNEKVLVNSRGLIGLRPDSIDCDFFDYLSGTSKKFFGEYMEQYSWAEFTKSMLLKV